MTDEYKIKIGTDEREIPGTVISYEDRKSGIISNKATTQKDFEVIEACRGVAELLDAKEIEIKIKSE